jgi:hypothetical protein
MRATYLNPSRGIQTLNLRIEIIKKLFVDLGALGS